MEVTSKQLVEEICAKDTDFAQLSYYNWLEKSQGVIVEAWSEGNKEEIKAKNLLNGTELVDHFVTRDYDVALWRMPSTCDYQGKTSYCVSINNDGHDPLDPNVQVAKFPGSSMMCLPRKQVHEILSKWVNRYGRLFVGTNDKRKYDIYKRLLSKHFNVEEMYPGVTGTPFYISNK